MKWVTILPGHTVIRIQVWTEKDNFICLNLNEKSGIKVKIFLHTCAKCSELSSNQYHDLNFLMMLMRHLSIHPVLLFIHVQDVTTLFRMEWWACGRWAATR